MTTYVMDDNGVPWFWNPKYARIQCMEATESGDGYPCHDLCEGLDILVEGGFLTQESAKRKKGLFCK